MVKARERQGERAYLYRGWSRRRAKPRADYVPIRRDDERPQSV